MNLTLKRVLNGLLSTLLLSATMWPCTTAVAHQAQGLHNTATSNNTTITVDNTGDLLVVSFWCITTCTVNSVQDDTGTATYTATTHSPGADGGSTGFPFVYYNLNPTAGSRTITVTTSTSLQSQVGATDVTLGAGCSATFNTDAAGTGTATTVNTPSITGSAGNFLYLFMGVSNSTNSVNSPWTQGTIYAGTANSDGYILSASGSSTSAAATLSSGSWSAIAVAFTISGGATPIHPHRAILFN